MASSFDQADLIVVLIQSAMQNGAGLHAYGNIKLTLQSCTFTNNHAHVRDLRLDIAVCALLEQFIANVELMNRSSGRQSLLVRRVMEAQF